MSNRIKEASAIEARLLELAHTTDAQITATALAYYAPCSIEDASRVLDDLTTRGVLSMDVQDDGSIVYTMLGRQKLHTPPGASQFAGFGAPHVAWRAPAGPSPLRPAVETRALVPMQRTHSASPALAAILSGFIPGAGHLYAGRVLAALMWFLVVGAGYALFFPGLILHIFSMVSAANAARQVGAPRGPLLLAA